MPPGLGRGLRSTTCAARHAAKLSLSHLLADPPPHTNMLWVALLSPCTCSALTCCGRPCSALAHALHLHAAGGPAQASSGHGGARQGAPACIWGSQPEKMCNKHQLAVSL